MKTTTFLTTAAVLASAPSPSQETSAYPLPAPSQSQIRVLHVADTRCGPQALITGEYADLEEYLTAVGVQNLPDICGHQVALSWSDGAPVLDYVDVEGGTSWYQAAQNIKSETTCNYSGTDCGNAGPIFSNWYWPDLPIC
ncbi:hypothetical protein BDW62DRAFT_204103 [Aspergillus aurantiobrunneus]